MVLLLSGCGWGTWRAFDSLATAVTAASLGVIAYKVATLPKGRLVAIKHEGDFYFMKEDLKLMKDNYWVFEGSKPVTPALNYEMALDEYKKRIASP